VADLLDELGPAWIALTQANTAARQAEAQLRLATHNDHATGGATALLGLSFSVDAPLIARGLLWHALGSEQGDQRMAGTSVGELDSQITRALRVIDEGLALQERKIRAYLDANR